MSDEKVRNALADVLTSGALDLDSTLNYTHVDRICKRHGAALDWDALEQAARNAMREYEAHGCMIWEIPTSRFVDEYLKLIKGGDE